MGAADWSPATRGRQFVWLQWHERPRGTRGISNTDIDSGSRVRGSAHSTGSAMLDDLARAWVKGAEIGWRTLYDKMRPRRVSLPVYPFARERCWIQSKSGGNAQAVTGVEHLHPLLHRNTSTMAGF